MLFLLLPRMLLPFFAIMVHFWLMVNLPSTRAIRLFFAKVLCRQSASSIYWCVGLLLHRYRTCCFPLFNFMMFFLVYFFSLLRSL